MPQPNPLQDLTVNRARLFGPPGQRGVLEAGLGAVRVYDVMPPGEVLFVPHMRLAEPLTRQLPPSRFAARFGDQLRLMARDALVDPLLHSGSHTSGDRPMRFRSFATYAAWLLATWVNAPPHISKPVLRAALGEKSIGQWQRQTVLADGRMVVRVIALLVRQGLVAPWLARLDPVDLDLALSAIARDYMLPELGKALAERPSIDAAPSTQSDADLAAGLAIIATKPRKAAETLSRLRGWVDAAVLGFITLPRPVRLLLIASFGVVKRTGELRLLSAADWQASVDTKSKLPSAIEAVRPRRAGLSAHPTDSLHRGAQLATSGAVEPNKAAESSLSSGADAHYVFAKKSAVKGKTEIPTEAAVQARGGEATANNAPPELSQTAAFATGFGGLFFLLNVLLWMELYPDFSRPRDNGLAASPFWLLSRLGRRLFGKAFTRDPLFAWLTKNGTRAPLPRRLQFDPGWMHGLDQPYRAPEKGGWLTELADFLTFRLAHSAQGVSADLLRLDANIALEEDRLKVRFRLAELPLPLRIAGLDRDPGWLPSEGRLLSFEFT